MNPEFCVELDGSKCWHVNGRLHRVDGPAVEYANGSEQWWLYGNLHRNDGPAISSARDIIGWWFNDNNFDGVGFLIDYFIDVFLYDSESLSLTWLPEVLIIDDVEFVRDHKERC